MEVFYGAQQGGLLGGAAQARAVGEGIPGRALVQQQPHQIPAAIHRGPAFLSALLWQRLLG